MVEVPELVKVADPASGAFTVIGPRPLVAADGKSVGSRSFIDQRAGGVGEIIDDQGIPIDTFENHAAGARRGIGLQRQRAAAKRISSGGGTRRRPDIKRRGKIIGEGVRSARIQPVGAGRGIGEGAYPGSIIGFQRGGGGPHDRGHGNQERQRNDRGNYAAGFGAEAMTLPGGAGGDDRVECIHTF